MLSYGPSDRRRTAGPHRRPHKRSLSDMDNRAFDSSPGHGRGFSLRSPPHGLARGAPQNCIHSPRGLVFRWSFDWTGRVGKARESIHNYIIVRCYRVTVNTWCHLIWRMESRIRRRMKRGMGSGVKLRLRPNFW